MVVCGKAPSGFGSLLLTAFPALGGFGYYVVGLPKRLAREAHKVLVCSMLSGSFSWYRLLDGCCGLDVKSIFVYFRLVFMLFLVVSWLVYHKFLIVRLEFRVEVRCETYWLVPVYTPSPECLELLRGLSL